MERFQLVHMLCCTFLYFTVNAKLRSQVSLVNELIVMNIQ